MWKCNHGYDCACGDSVPISSNSRNGVWVKACKETHGEQRQYNKQLGISGKIGSYTLCSILALATVIDGSCWRRFAACCCWKLPWNFYTYVHTSCSQRSTLRQVTQHNQYPAAKAKTDDMKTPLKWSQNVSPAPRWPVTVLLIHLFMTTAVYFTPALLLQLKTKQNIQQIQSSIFLILTTTISLHPTKLCQTKTHHFAVNFIRRQVFITSSFSGVNTERKITNWIQDAKAAPVKSKRASKKKFSCFRLYLQAIISLSDIRFSVWVSSQKHFLIRNLWRTVSGKAEMISLKKKWHFGFHQAVSYRRFTTRRYRTLKHIDKPIVSVICDLHQSVP